MHPPHTVHRPGILFLLLLFPLCSASAQMSDPHSQEVNASVPALSDFHEVIYQIWHTAWPEKNLSILVDVLPQVQQYTDSLTRAELPGILRDKQAAWDLEIAALQSIVNQYAAATSPLDSVKLLDAAERLHAQYETLVRTIRPVTKEIDQFHQVLYMIYHHYWPNKDQEKLVSSVASLNEKMSALNSAQLPDRLKSKQEAYGTARTNLSQALEMLVASDAASNPDKFGSDLERVHSRYQALEQVFE